MPERLELEHDREIRADLVCVLCSRTAGRVQGPNLRPRTPMSVRVQDPQHVDAVRRLRCPYCSGRLWLQNSEEIHVNRRPLTSEDLRPRRGRPSKLRRAS
jgi:DNA-directed RNA polymerase subunit RPC12/RpoP